MTEMKLEVTKIAVQLEGLSPIVFNKFIDYSSEKRPPEQKLYLTDGNKIVFPSDNIDAFLWGESPTGCAKRFEGRAGKNYMTAGLGHVFITPQFIPFKCNGKEVVFNKFEEGKQLYTIMIGGRVKKGSMSIKQEAQPRPVLNLPWTLEFKIEVVKNDFINAIKLENWFAKGALLIGLGSFRPKYGRFCINKFEIL